MDVLFLPVTDLGPSALASSLSQVFLIHATKPAHLRAEVRKLCPKRPGVYGMIDRHGELIYVGKAKFLRTRLLGYFRRRGVDRKAKRIVAQARAVLWEVSTSEFAALHRELELIRRWRPRWNVQGQPLRRRFTHLCIGRSPAPYCFLSRRPPKNLVACFGPIPDGARTVAVAQRLNDLFQLRDCPQKEQVIFADQTELFPVIRSAGCLRYEIATCLAPCAGTCSSRDYDSKVRSARRFLEGNDASPLKNLEEEMTAAAQAQEFERAANLRDRLQLLRWLWDRLERIRRAKEEDHFIYPVTGSDGAVIWYLIHGGRTIAATPQPVDAETAGAAARLIESVYQKNHARSLEAYEHVDGFMIVSLWFKRFPGERERTITPEMALVMCERLSHLVRKRGNEVPST